MNSGLSIAETAEVEGVDTVNEVNFDVPEEVETALEILFTAAQDRVSNCEQRFSILFN
jgi:hypothetical protein